MDSLLLQNYRRLTSSRGRQILLCFAPQRKLTGVCFSGEFAQKGAKVVISKFQGGGEGAEEGSEASGAEDKGKGGLDLGGLLGGNDDKKDGGE